MFFKSILFALAGAWAGEVRTGQGLEPVTLDQALQSVQPGHILVVGEIHGQADIAATELEILQTLRRQGKQVSVGMEFVEYPRQVQLDDWRSGRMNDAEFVQKVWGQKNYPLNFYKPQMMFPRSLTEFTQALNLPRSVTGKIWMKGLPGLSKEDLALMPPGFTIGNWQYYNRFMELDLGQGHCPDMFNCFTAQSAWDDTMAWQAMNFINAHPEQILVIIVGEFHVQYGGGLPDRLKGRGAPAVHTISLLAVGDMSEADIQKEAGPSPRWGVRADHVILHDIIPSTKIKHKYDGIER